MCEQTEIKYMQGDIVWVKLNSLWWPGEVVNIDNIPNEMQLEVKKKSIISIVKFFDEDKYELVKSFQLIRRYDCFHKEEYIQKGLDKFRTKGKEGYMKKFPEDVEMAEKLSGGNINILSDKKYVYENKPDTSNLFGKKKHIKQKKPYSETSLKKKINKINKTKINQASNKISYGINICKQPNLLQHNYNEKTYPCPSCHYVASRVNVIIYHIKSHKFNNNMLDKKKLKFRKKIKHSQVSLDFTKQKNEKKSLFNEITVSNNDDSRIGKRKRVKEVEKSLKKKKTHPELKEKLLADWNDEFDESEDLKHKNQTSLELESNKLNKNNNDLMIDTDIILKETELFVKYSKINESKENMKEKENENFIEKKSENFLNIENTSLKNENLKLDKEKSKLSCFDFDEDEITESTPNMSSVRKLSENKIVQLNKKIINESEKTNLKNKVLKKKLKIVDKKNLDFEENFKIAKKEESNIFLKDSLRTNKNKYKDDTYGALKFIALSADTTPAESSSVIDKYDIPLKIASTEISENKKKLNTETACLIGQNDSLKLIAENSFYEKYSLNNAEELHFLTLNEDNGSDKIGINKIGLDQQTDKKSYPFTDEYKKSNSELKNNLKDDSVSSNKNSISEIFIGEKKVTKQIIEKTLNEISEKNSFEVKKKFCDNSLDSDIDINVFPASLSKKKEYDLIPAKNNLKMEIDENTCKSSNLTTSNIQCKGASSPNQFQKIKTDLSINEFYFKDEKQCITSFDLFKNPNEKKIAIAENNLGLTEENSLGIAGYKSIFSKDEDKKEISKEVAFDAKNVLEIECNVNCKIKDLDRQNSLKPCPSTILTKNIYNLDIEKGIKNEESFSNDNQTSTYNPLKIGIKEPKSLVLNDENFESTKLEIGKVTEFDEKNDNISLVNMYMDKKLKNPKEYSLIEIKTSGYTVPVKKREKPRIIENVALKEPMIFKQKHLEKSTEKFKKNQIENVSNIEKSGSINSTRIDNANSGINKSTENADLLSDISKTEIKLIKTLNCSVPNILDNSIDSTPFVPKCKKDSQLLNSASQILGDIDLDINSMPFVMQEDLLEPVNLEHFPVVVSSALNTSIPNVSSKLVLTNANKQPLIIKPSNDISSYSSSKSSKKKSITPTILKNKTKSRPTITSIKTIIPPIVSIEKNSKLNAVPTISVANNQNTISGKYVIVQAGRQQAQYSVQAKGGTISKSCTSNRNVSENTQIVQQGGKVVILGPQISNFTPADRLQENIANKGKALIQTPILLNSKSSIQLNNINCSPRNNTKFDCQKILNSVSIIDKSSANMKPRPHEDLQKNNTGLPYTSSIMPSISSLSTVFSAPTITSNVAHYHKIKTKNVLESPTQVHTAKTMLTTQNLIHSKGPKFKPITRQQVKAIAAQHPKDLKIQKKITISQRKLQSSSSNSFNDQTNSSNFLHGNMILLNKNEEYITETTCSNKKQETNKNLLHNNSEEKIQIEKINIKSNQPKTNKNNIDEKNDVPIDWNIESTKPQIADTKTINVNIISSQETNVKEKETNKIKVVPEFNLDEKAKNILKLEIEPSSKNKSETSIIYDTNNSPTCLIPVVNEISDKKQSLYVLVYNDQDQMQTLDSSFYDHSSNLRDSNDFDGLVVNLASDADNKKSKNIINALSLNESQSTNQDILAVALANTDFQNEIEIEEVTESNVISSNLTPTSLINQTILQSTIIPPMDPITSPSVSETSLTLNQPIMSPVEIRSNLSQTSMIIKSKNTNNLINLNNQMNPLDNESKTSETKTQESKSNWLSTANEMCSENTTVPTKNLLPSKDINEEIKNIDTLSHQNSTQDNQKVEGNCYILPTEASEKVLLKPDFNILTENQSTIFLESSNNLSNEEFQNSSYKFLFKSQIDSSEDKLEKIVETKDENITNFGFKNKKITLFDKDFSEDSSKNYNNLIGERTHFLKDSNVFETHKNIEVSKNKSDDKNKAVIEILNDNEGKLTNTTLIDNNNLPFIVQVSKLGTEMEDSNEINQNVIYNQESNSQVNNIIGSSTSVNNLLVNEDEIAGSSYIPETPENQERDQDQESAISTSSYEIPPCEDLNITSGTEIPSSCIQIVHHSSNNDIFGNTDSSFNTNHDISSSTDLLPTSCYHDEIVIEANESSYEIPIPMQHIEETIPKSFIINSTENSNDETDYYSDQRKNQGNFYSLCKEQSGSQVLRVESENFFINNENLRTSRQYFNDANEGESSFSQQVMTENFFQNQANVEPNEDYFSNQNLININEPTVQNIDSVQTYFKNSGNQITSQQELMPSYTENYEVASSEILQNQKATAKEN